MNTRADIDDGGSDRRDHNKKVAAVNSLERERPRPNQLTTFSSIEGSWYTSLFFNSVFLIKSVAIDTESFKACGSNGLILLRKFYGRVQGKIGLKGLDYRLALGVSKENSERGIE